jgi:hypothetical protein
MKIKMTQATSSALDWKDEMPTEPGKYYFRSHPIFEAREIELRQDDAGEIVFDAKEALRVFDRPALQPQWAKATV